MSKARPFGATLQMKIDKAIANRLVVEMPYRGGMRLVEPYYRALTPEGNQYVLAWQIGGDSHSGNLPDWRSFHLSEIDDVRVLATPFRMREHNRAEIFEQFQLTEALYCIEESESTGVEPQ